MSESSSYSQQYSAWHDDPIAYWAERATSVEWASKPVTVFDAEQGPYGCWFPDGVLNTAVNCLDRHVDAGRGESIALIWDSAMTHEVRTYTYAHLLRRVARVAGALTAEGVGPGDRVVIYMPMIPEAAITMLACARIGAIHSVVFGGFAAAELASRIAASSPSAIVTASCGLEPTRIVEYKPIVDEARRLANREDLSCFVLQRPECWAEMGPLDIDFIEAEAAAEPALPVPRASTDPLYLLYTSGTTAQPKGIVRDNGGHAVALANSMRTVFGIRPGDVFWAASDVGWVVGHSYIVYAPLLAGATTVMYEGKPVGTPDERAFWRVCSDHRVTVLFTAPTAIRAIRQRDPSGLSPAHFDLSQLKAVYLAGERCDPPTAVWLTETLQIPVVDNWWQTETGWPITARFRGYGLTEFKPGSGGRPSPGFEVAVLTDQGDAVPAGDIGNIVLKLPLPPGCAPTLWQDDTGYQRAYLDQFPGWYRTGDGGQIDPDGDVWIMGRTDDVINVAGHRLSTGALEEVLATHPAIAECAVVGRADSLKGEVPIGLVVLKANVTADWGSIRHELDALVRSTVGPVAAMHDLALVIRLPKTRSGKILRRTLRDLVNGSAVVVPPTIEDPAVVDEVAETLRISTAAHTTAPPEPH